MKNTCLSTVAKLKIWTKASANNLARLAQGVSTIMPTCNNAIFFIKNNRVPKHKRVTYGQIKINPHKEENHRFRLTVGVDCLDLDRETTTQRASLSTTKIMMNRTISTPREKFIKMDLNDFWYFIPMKENEYIQILLSSIPQEIIIQYDLTSTENNTFVYI